MKNSMNNLVEIKENYKALVKQMDNTKLSQEYYLLKKPIDELEKSVREEIIARKITSQLVGSYDDKIVEMSVNYGSEETVDEITYKLNKDKVLEYCKAHHIEPKYTLDVE
jgi:hypothetical protein